ncbi:NAD/NADP transhydrogenase alpha subunit [Paenibacillus aurantius]|uniref:NAD/NADP transhydrogenase alpha subunit n=1 Tax=Paenibacillus aurantius TaxID=2918900 RepID=A0AA96RDB1_9BACL|nr:NAD/NADP transhydrogenase alpha subunit [Paenibacillus aurantius]WJH34145.1 NAD/NADP transhydrogenase alpha subunit [Paenibacillus sp. CC-CFT747]WNQ09221.1 NAD/NADP transhydrogenase alpha subunit [Paenibacillus aurantius]
MKCIAVYTKNFELFSDIYETVLSTPLADNEEKEIEGVMVSESGEVPENYLERMKTKPEVVVMKVKDKDITILQHGDVFEIFLPEKESALLS